MSLTHPPRLPQHPVPAAPSAPAGKPLAVSAYNRKVSFGSSCPMATPWGTHITVVCGHLVVGTPAQAVVVRASVRSSSFWVPPRSPPTRACCGRQEFPSTASFLHSPSPPTCSCTPGLGTRDQTGWAQGVPHQGRGLHVSHRSDPVPGQPGPSSMGE